MTEGVGCPYGVVASDDPLMRKTVEHIEESILRDGDCIVTGMILIIAAPGYC